MTWKTYYPHPLTPPPHTQKRTHINLNHQPPPLTLPLFPGVCETTKSFGELPKSFWLFETGREGGGCAFVCYQRHVCVRCVSLCMHVLRGHAGAAG